MSFCTLLFVLCIQSSHAFVTPTTSHRKTTYPPGTGIPTLSFVTSPLSTPTSLCIQSSDNDDSQSTTSTTSSNFALDPDSDQARTITKSLGISPECHDQLSDLASLVVEWNDRINLISRKDCTKEVVFGRHILPSVALAALPDSPFGSVAVDDEDDEANLSESKQMKRVVDVGTGGGFPGLPLAIISPNVEFMLVDSVGKKLKAVEAMADELDIPNVAFHNGRAEEMSYDKQHSQRYDVCLGRSVAALPKFCFWTHDLLKRGKNDNQGRLFYIIGGDVEEKVQSKVLVDVELDAILDCEGASDKRALVFTQEMVTQIAKQSGEVKQKPPKAGGKKGNNSNKKPTGRKKQQASRGSWKKRGEDEDVPKQRGNADFKRY